MRVLALTHAHLTPDGLSPVSCERADSIIGAWADQLHWDIDVVHTKNTKWRGIWPDGKGLQVNIINEPAPPGLMMGPQELFSQTVKKLIADKKFLRLASLATRRISKRIRAKFATEGIAMPYEMVKAKQWGQHLFSNTTIHSRKYDFIFACVGHGDEYLLQAAFTLSEKLHAPMVVDFRDLWSEHHEETRFTDKQRKLVRKYEHRLLSNTILLSVPQKPMAAKFEQYLKIPVHLTSHSAHVEKNWKDGEVVSNEFRMLYAGKIYAGNPGLDLLLQLLKKLSAEKLPKPVKCHFYIDETESLKKTIAPLGIESNMVIHDWVSPAAIWKEMRSAHLLLIFDGGFFRGMPLIMTKTYQYAYTGRPILALSKNGNVTYEEFFRQYNAGKVCTGVDEAFTWVKELMADEQQYQTLPGLRKVPTRSEIAVEFGNAIENLLKAKLSVI